MRSINAHSGNLPPSFTVPAVPTMILDKVFSISVESVVN